jgi:hypothetical protein
MTFISYSRRKGTHIEGLDLAGRRGPVPYVTPIPGTTTKKMPNHPTQFATLEIEKQNSHTQDPKSHLNGGFFSSTDRMQPAAFLKRAGLAVRKSFV